MRWNRPGHEEQAGPEADAAIEPDVPGEEIEHPAAQRACRERGAVEAPRPHPQGQNGHASTSVDRPDAIHEHAHPVREVSSVVQGQVACPSAASRACHMTQMACRISKWSSPMRRVEKSRANGQVRATAASTSPHRMTSCSPSRRTREMAPVTIQANGNPDHN